jgi:hypothetical protein
MTIANRVTGTSHRGMLFSIAAAVVAATLVTGFAGAQNAGERSTLSVSGPRPVEEAVQQLVSRYGYVITYEDPQYSYGGDLRDVTAEVRTDLQKFAAGKAPKVLGHVGGTLTFSVPAASSFDRQTMAGVLKGVIQAQEKNEHGGHFRVEETEGAFHVVPGEWRDRNGNWASHTSILDAPISLPMQERSFPAMLEAICNAVGSASHVDIVVGTGATTSGERYALGADNEPARLVLSRALKSTEKKLTWLLLYGNDLTERMYALNILAVPDRMPTEN